MHGELLKLGFDISERTVSRYLPPIRPGRGTIRAWGTFLQNHREVLAATISSYQKLGNWSPHVDITRAAWEATLDIFLHAGLITKRHRYEDVIAPPPSG